MGECYITRRYITNKTNNGTMPNEFQVFGDSAYFDASSVDTESGVWKNILNPEHNIEITSGITVSGDEVIFSPDEYGTYATDPLFTIYTIFKSNSTGYEEVICKRTTTGLERASFDIEIDDNSYIWLSGNRDNINSKVQGLNEYHVVCIVRDGVTQKGCLYIDGVFYGITANTLIDSNYQGTYLINRRITTGSTVYGRGNNTFKAIVFDTEPHSTETIIDNIKYLRDKYLNEME